MVELSEDELFELGIWAENGARHRLEDMSDALLNSAIMRVEQAAQWRKDWLPELLVERDRREEARQSRDDDFEVDMSTCTSPLQQVMTEYLLRLQKKANEISIEQAQEFLRIAELLPKEGPLPELPGDKFELHIVSDVSGEQMRILKERMQRVGKERFLRAVFGERPTKPAGLNFEFIVNDETQRAFEKLATALESLRDTDKKPWQKTATFLKHERNKYRK